MIAWADMQDALYAWVADTSGLSEDTFGFQSPEEVGLDTPEGFGNSPVIWAFQSATQPRLPFAMLKLSPARKVGGLDEVNLSENDSHVGAEMIQTVRGHREVTLTLEVFSNAVVNGKTASDYIERALISLRLPTQLYSLRQAGLSLVGWDNVVDLSVLVATAYQSRAQVDVKFYLLDTVSEATGYIETVEVTPTINEHEYPVVDVPVVE